MSEAALRDRIAAFGRSIFKRGLTFGATGNISVRLDDGWLMTPTGSSLGELDPARISIYLIEDMADIYDLDIGHPDQVAFVTQTTLSVDDTLAMIAVQGPEALDHLNALLDEPLPETLKPFSAVRRGAWLIGRTTTINNRQNTFIIHLSLVIRHFMAL